MDADLVFHGGPVFTPASGARHRATAVAVASGRIIAVGGDEVRDLIGPRTEVVSLEGRLLIPGFQDAHVHPVGGGRSLSLCNLREATTPDAALATVAAYSAAHPRAADGSGEWIMGGGWYMSLFPGGTPTAALLDTVVPDRPVFLANRDAHGAWVNSLALRRAGIDVDTPDPRDGRIERDAEGNPTGMLHEGAMKLVDRLIPEATEAELASALLAAQVHLHALGITAWQDAIIGDYADLRNPASAYLAVGNQGSLTARVVGALWWDRERGLEQIGELVERREQMMGGRFAATTVKIMQDGVAENFTAAMLSPYADGHGHSTDNSGISFVPPELLNEAVPALDALGFQVHFHAIGDRAVRESLDAVEAAIARNGRSDNRHHIAHIQVVHPEDIPRFRELGVAANMQALWATYEAQMTDLTLPFLGPERGAWQYPFGELARAGARLAAGSDWPVSSPDPLAAIHTAVNRHAPDADPAHGPFLPAQALSLEQALTAYTAGSAWVNHLDAVSGSLAVGEFADLAVLDRDPLAGPGDEIAGTRVEQTFVEGERVFHLG
jgi:predicted amidohydrolase YtcJ